MADKPFYQFKPYAPNPGGKPMSKGLFKQYNEEGVYDLEEWHKVFIELCDPTEYTAAIQLCGSWYEWQRIKRLWPEFRDTILAAWLEEVEVKLRSTAVTNLADQAKQGSSAAAKFIAEGKYIPTKAGRPTKAHIQREARIAAGVDKETEEDLARVRQSLN